MHVEPLQHCLESVESARSVLQSWQVRDLERGWRNLTYLANSLPPDSFRDLSAPLARFLPRCPDADMSLNSLERFLANPAARERLPSLLESRARTLEILLQLFSTSQSFSDLLAANPDYVDMLRVPLRRSPGPDELRGQLQAEVDAAYEDSAVLAPSAAFGSVRRCASGPTTSSATALWRRSPATFRAWPTPPWRSPWPPPCASCRPALACPTAPAANQPAVFSWPSASSAARN